MISDDQHSKLNCADVAGPPSLIKPLLLPPATVDIIPPVFTFLTELQPKSELLFVGADWKEFVDVRLDIDDMMDDVLKYRTALNILQSTQFRKDKLFSTAQVCICWWL